MGKGSKHRRKRKRRRKGREQPRLEELRASQHSQPNILGTYNQVEFGIDTHKETYA